MKVSVTDLRGKVAKGVQKLGYQNEDANTIAEVLLYAQLRGNNQGITKSLRVEFRKLQMFRSLKLSDKRSAVH